MRRFLRNNGLSVVLFGSFAVFLLLQSIFGWLADRNDALEHDRVPETYLSYVGSGGFVEATFENWESEFLQMAAYVVLTALLVQRGSPESKSPDSDESESVGEVTAASPRPVRIGGWQRKVYENSLSIVLVALFAMSFVLHLLGGTSDHNQNLAEHGKPPISAWEFLGSSEFWFQSMQNWQSEFLAMGALVVLGIWLRQRGSPESKPVAAPHSQTG